MDRHRTFPGVLSTVKTVTLLGATGSIGRNTLDVIQRHPDRYRVFALTANERVEELIDLCASHRPDLAVIGNPAHAARLAAELKARGLATEVLAGVEGLIAAACDTRVDAVMAAIVGGAGLEPTLAAARAGKQVLLANKEALVMAGQLMLDAVETSGAALLPVDSEHNAIFQCLPPGTGATRGDAPSVTRLLLTASGGPFRTASLDTMRAATPDMACAHPNWVMGRKISIDSATLMNKGLEVIEARWLFGLPLDRIDVVVHPQSVIHSMVEYVDGSVLAQLGTPDMRTPIAYALAWPQRIASGSAPLDFMKLSALTFEAPDLARFPCLALAYAALRAGGAATIALNAANEIAVAAFLAQRIRFTDIAAVVEAVLQRDWSARPGGIAQVRALDGEARRHAQEQIDTVVIPSLK